MKGLTIFQRTTKKAGTIKLRFRLRDGRNVDLYHKSNILADLKDLAVFTPEGELKPRVSVYNRELKLQIDIERFAIEKAYYNLCRSKDKSLITPNEFEESIERELYPERKEKVCNENFILLDRFRKFIDDNFKDGLIQAGRYRHYGVLHRILERFLLINSIVKITPEQFTADMVVDFRRFLFEEYIYVDRYPSIYDSVNLQKHPITVRSQNTVATKLKMLQSFFNDLVVRDEIPVSPFAKVGKAKKQIIMREQYDAPVCLTLDEFEKILNKENVPQTLKETRDCFLLQCAFGCRISDFKRLSMKKVSVNDEGVPY